MPLSLERSHRYQNLDQRSSFGPGVFSAYDANLTLSANGSGVLTSVEWYSANESQGFLCTPIGTGTLTNDSHKRVKAIHVRDASNAPTSTLANAQSAVVERWDGTQDTFEIFSLGSDQVRHARLIEQTDRAGNTTVIAYAHPVTADDAALDYDRTKLWKIDTITDPQGRSAEATYGWHDGQWVITELACPDATTRDYGYGTGFLPGLNSVTFPGGDVSTYQATFDFGAQEQGIVMHEVAAPQRIRKGTLFLTPSFNDQGAVAPNRVRRLEDGSGGLRHFTWTERLTTPDADGADTYTFVFEGGGELAVTGSTEPVGTLQRFGTINGLPVATYRALTWDLLQATSTYTWELVERTEYDSAKRMVARTVPNGTSSGLRTAYTRDPLSGAVTGTTVTAGGPALKTTSWTVNAFQQPLTAVDELGRSVVRTYDADGNMLTETVAVGTADEATRSWTYTSRGQVETATDERGFVTAYTYDANGFLLTRLDPPDLPGGPQALWQWAYDAAGRLETTTDPASRTVSYDYDGRGRLTTITYGDGTTETTTYGSGASANLVIATKDRNNHVTAYDHDADGRPTTVTTGDENPATAVVETIAYLPGSTREATRSGKGQAVAHTYDHRLRRIATTALVGGTTTLTEEVAYDSAGRQTLTTDAYGRRTFFVYDQENRLVRQVKELIVGGVSNPSGVATLARSSVANPAYVIEDLVYDSGDNVVARVDGRGIRHTTAYDARNRIREVVEAEAQDAGGGVFTPVYADAARTVLAYDASSNLIRTELPRSFQRDAVLGWINGSEGAFWTTATWSGRNLKLSETVAAGLDAGSAVRPERATTTWTYTLTGKVATTTDARGNATDPVTAGFTTLFGYAVCCDRLTQVTDALGFITQFGYDGNGNRTSVTDANTNATTTLYDAFGRLLSTTNAELETTTFVYDDDLSDAIGLSDPLVTGSVVPYLTGIPAMSAVRSVNALNEIQFEIRDGLGRVVRRVDALGHATTTTHDTVVAGLVEASVTDALGNTNRSHSDALGQVRVVVDAIDEQATFAYDANGNRVQTRDANGIGDDCTYDLRNRELACTTTRSDVAVVTSATYDAHSNVLTQVDALGKTTTQTFDALDRKKTVLNRIAALTTFRYDLVGNLIRIIDAEGDELIAGKGVTDYVYDARNLLTAEAYPTGSGGVRTVRSYTYDPGRRLETRTVATQPVSGFSEVTTYAYDAANRLLDRIYPDGRNDAFAYDGVGRLVSATSDRYRVDVSRAYDAAGRLTSEAQIFRDGSLSGTTVSQATFTVGYAYDDANRTTEITYPDGATVTRGYTARHQLASVGHMPAGGSLAPVITRLYDDGGRLTQSTYGNGIVETRGYVPGDHAVQSIASSAVSLTYTYDANRRKTAENDLILSGNNQTFGYDDQDRLTAWTKAAGVVPAQTQAWTLSPVGDWDATTRDGVTETRTHTAVHELTGRTIGANPTIPLAYDAKGNLTDDGEGRAYTWDPENRLQGARVRSDASPTAFGITATYQYDALGRRAAKTVNGRTTRFLSAGAQVVEERDAPAIPPQAMINGADSDGTIANAELPPASGGILDDPDTIRINFQPQTALIPAGYYADKGKAYSMRTNALTYGWNATKTSDTVTRNGAVPVAELDTLILMEPSTTAHVWEITLPNGTYPVIVVAGDPLSTVQTNDLQIENQSVTDPDPSVTATYTQGDFDGYAVLATVADGKLTISMRVSGDNAKLCFVEIGPQGTGINTATLDRLATLAAQATDQTANAPQSSTAQRQYVFGPYVDELLSYTVGTGSAPTRYFANANALYSIAAVTDAAGAIVERYAYDSYGKRTVIDASGTMQLAKSAVSQAKGFTGLNENQETGLLCSQTRPYHTSLGRWLGRDILGYIDGMGLYNGYFVPNYLDPTGMEDYDPVIIPVLPPPPRLPVGVPTYGPRELGEKTTTIGVMNPRTFRIESVQITSSQAGDGLETIGEMIITGATLGQYLEARILLQGIAAAGRTAATRTAIIRGTRCPDEFSLFSPARGLAEEAVFAQRTFGEAFSSGGKFAGKTVDEVASALQSGHLKPGDVPIDYIIRDGNMLIMNTRSAQALQRAGIPRSQWSAVNRTGDDFFEGLLSGQLRRNRLGVGGIVDPRSSGLVKALE